MDSFKGDLIVILKFVEILFRIFKNYFPSAVYIACKYSSILISIGIYENGTRKGFINMK